MKNPSKMSTEELEPFAREWMRRIRGTEARTPKVLAPCRYCGAMFGARERRAHEPRCDKR